MGSPTDIQIEFAKGMSARQWATLGSLEQSTYFLSASERGDPELWALVKNKLAYTRSIGPGVFGLWCWTATDEGKALSQQHYAHARLRVPFTTPH